MTESIGSVSVKVLPDLAQFEEILRHVPDAGLTVTEDVTYERDDNGYVVRQTTVRTISKAI
jgi:hypothetical protein